MDISGKVAIITGGASGLGEATVRRFHALGGKVAIFDRDEERGAAIVADLGENVKFYKVDVTDEADVDAAVAGVEADLGVPHILCNYAGISVGSKIYGRKGTIDMALFQKHLDINLTGTVLVSAKVAAAMVKGDPVDADGQRGVIINTSSIAATEGQVGQTPYTATKAAVLGIALPMARDLWKEGIRVNTIVPGLIHTPLFDTVPEDMYKSLESQVLYPKRLGKPDEIARTAQFLVENDYMNAESIRMDGGIRMQAT